ncbi:MAG: hypothetical protein OXU69_02900 [Gemmatimonadota bacterium]|nr:hypothetical protein [Gemmatimonadota bacterium]MDE2983630.1 hypothetical protein [Gemmatimonadota bacterium]
MSSATPGGGPTLRYQPDEQPPPRLAIGVGLQLAILNIAAVMLIPMVVMRAAGMPDAYLSWAVLASVTICGAATVLQALRAGRIGSGHVIVMGTSGAFIPACIMALDAGGPALLATLVTISALVPLLLSWRLSLFQRILTPAVSGTVIMLIPVTVLPFISGLLSGTPEGGTAPGAPLSFFATVLVIGALALKATGQLRLWAPVIGVVAGSAIAAFHGLYDLERVAMARWVDLQPVRPPGFDLAFGPGFWPLLASFLLVAVIAAVRTMSSAIAVQRVSWRRKSRAVDFRAVQGAMTVDGLGNLLAGLAGTVPGSATTTSVPLTQLTGVAARVVGIVAGAAFVAFAFLPKAFAVVFAIPDPVFAGYLAILLAMLFAIGMKIVLQDGLGYREGMVVGVAFLAGVGFQNGMIFPDQVSRFAGGLFENGMNAGGFTAILMTLFLRLTDPRPSRLRTRLDPAELPAIRKFLHGFATRNNWNEATADRLAAATEETLVTLLDEETRSHTRRLLLTAQRTKDVAVLELFVAPAGENLQNRIALLREDTGETLERQVSTRLLRHLASSVKHRQYHDTDIVTIHVET